MYNHQPKNYQCPFCQLANGQDSHLNTQNDIVYQNQDVLAFISPKWWLNNPGHVIVIPKQHIENLYDISDKLLAEVYKVVTKIALAVRATYGCTGTSTRQHNEPDGTQDVWHFHVHVFPRYKDDSLYQDHDKKKFVTSAEKQEYVRKLKGYFKENMIK